MMDSGERGVAGRLGNHRPDIRETDVPARLLKNTVEAGQNELEQGGVGADQLL